MSDVVAVVLAVALLALTAFFVGAEFALISARRTQFRIRSATSQPDSRALRGGPWSPVHAQVWVRRPSVTGRRRGPTESGDGSLEHPGARASS